MTGETVQGAPEYTKLRTALKAGSGAPDAVQIEYQLLPTFEATNDLVDLSKYGAGKLKSSFASWTWKQVSRGSHVYAVPQDAGPMGLLYRRDIFQKYHLAVPKTWAQFASEAKKLHAANSSIYITNMPTNDPGEITGLMWQANSRPFHIMSARNIKIALNDAPAMKVAKFWGDLVSAKAVADENDFTPSWYKHMSDGTYASWVTAAWGAVDAQLMRDAGFQVVRMAEFAWSHLESESGQFDWGWLDRAIDLLHRHGINTILGTPTATPPLWLVRRHLDIRGMALDGTPWYEGSRRHTCPSSPTYRRESARIVRVMAERYRDHPAVIGWQIDNELGCHVFECGCPNCERGFREWVRERYGTIEAVNAAWGTVVWSNEFCEWDDIPLPRPMPALPNPSPALAYRRFISDAFVQFQDGQVGILRELCPGQFVTHNMMGLFSGINYYDLAESLDFVSWDNYPGFFAEGQPMRLDTTALAADVMRGVKDNRPLWVMEQQAGPTTWDYVGPTPRPGQIRLWAYQAIARGANAIVYFRWRTNHVGAEQFWHGLLDHSGEINRRYAEAKRMGEELPRLDAIADTRVPAEVAIVRDYDAIWAFQIQKQTPRFSYEKQIAAFHQALTTLHIPVHVIAPSADLSGYTLVILPSPYILHPGQAERLERYVQGGGHVIVTARAGVKNSDNVVTEQALPGPLTALCGVVVEEYDALTEDRNALRWGDAVYPIHGWADILKLEGAESLATYESGYYAGRPALTLHAYGRGQALYLGTLGDQDFYLRLVRTATRNAGVTPLLGQPVPLEASRRAGSGGSYLFLLNHGGDAVEATGIAGVDLLSGQQIDGCVTVQPRDLVIIKEKQET